MRRRKADASSYFLIIASLMKDQPQLDLYGEDPKAELLKIAAQTGMDEAAFDTCLQRQELVDLINSNTKEAIEKFNIQGTPAFILDGRENCRCGPRDFTKALDDATRRRAIEYKDRLRCVTSAGEVFTRCACFRSGIAPAEESAMSGLIGVAVCAGSARPPLSSGPLS
ncbi:MAG: thioredoxin domain-containing protein [Parvularculaceae bacterium]